MPLAYGLTCTFSQAEASPIILIISQILTARGQANMSLFSEGLEAQSCQNHGLELS